MPTFKSSFFLPGLLLCCHSLTAVPKNVLLISVDDLRPQLSIYGSTHQGATDIHAPNFEALAADGTVFTRNYCQIPVCGASRLSLMTGARPYKTAGQATGRFWTFDDQLSDPNNKPGDTLA